jgi:1-deoxy-D-xylulose-5-phosphate synthase
LNGGHEAAESLLRLLDGGKKISDFTHVELGGLCDEVRRLIIGTVSKNGGHLSSNLGVVELTVALHHVFDLPNDKIVWDVGHQCYTHKILTGRRNAFATLRQSGGLAGFPRRAESEYDAFSTGHASTSISAALGILAGEHMIGGGTNRVVAVIGDGALTGGLAYEGLSGAAHLGLPLIIVLNDNRMSISPNVGGLSQHLSRLSMRRQYQTFRSAFDSMSKKIPLIGGAFFRLIQRLKRAVKAVFYQDNFFVELGFEYVGPIDGHDLRLLIDILRDIRELRRPVVVHVVTEKGKGYAPAAADPGAFHGVPPFCSENGSLPAGGESWTHAFSRAVVEAARVNKKIAAITAAMEKGTGLQRFRQEFPERFFDVGIAEAHAVTFAAALASRGYRPVVAVYSTFLQRAVDSIIHDTALDSLPVVFALDRAGFVAGDGETHQGLFDISLLRAVPNITVLAPADAGELKLMLGWALCQNNPCAIRYPKAELPPEEPAFRAPIEPGRGVLIRADAIPNGDGGGHIEGGHTEGGAPPARVCLAFTGSLYPQALEAARALALHGEPCDLYNLRFLSHIDEPSLTRLASGYAVFVVAEEGLRNGGVGEYVAGLAHECTGSPKILLLNCGGAFYRQASRNELLQTAALDGPGIASSILDYVRILDSRQRI